MAQLIQESNRDGAAALRISQLSFAYPGQDSILENLSLQIGAGERVGLIGPNGSGKTTLFLLICGILTPVAGEIELFGRAVETGEFRPELGLVFQNPNDQLFTTSVRDDVAFGPKNMALDTKEIETRVRESLTATGVAELIDRVPQNLSGGEKSMVAIASVLAMRPQLILYDEPTANLDLRARRRLIRFLANSQQTFILSTHDLELVLEVCDRVLLLDEGQIVADGIPQEVMKERPLMEDHGLEVPHSLTHRHG
ncbi:MAG: energy-coupling factor ABC transporter ATP-binding protein [Cyanophyceae cyanobacterium]